MEKGNLSKFNQSEKDFQEWLLVVWGGLVSGGGWGWYGDFWEVLMFVVLRPMEFKVLILRSMR